MPDGGQLQASNYPDGNIVEKGAQAFVLRQLTPANRNVKTCSTTFGSCTTLTNFSTANSNVTAALPNDVINWARGSNVDDELDKGTGVMRPSIHGDVLHSRHADQLRHGRIAEHRGFYGGNDGMLRASMETEPARLWWAPTPTQPGQSCGHLPRVLSEYQSIEKQHVDNQLSGVCWRSAKGLRDGRGR
ncbi:MAG: hypothetical protein IPK05_07670 [Comamonadaceae bacterium]|nr:hypothetical protein [Comamonadaceae bacterium]